MSNNYNQTRNIHEDDEEENYNDQESDVYSEQKSTKKTKSSKKKLSEITELKFHSSWEEVSVVTKPLTRNIELTYHIDSNSIDIMIENESDDIYSVNNYESPTTTLPIYIWDMYIGSHFHLLGRYTTIKQVSDIDTSNWLRAHQMLLVDYRDELRDRVLRYKPIGVKNLGTLDWFGLNGETNTHHVVWQINILIEVLKEFRPNMHIQILNKLKKRYHVKEELFGIKI